MHEPFSMSGRFCETIRSFLRTKAGVHSPAGRHPDSRKAKHKRCMAIKTLGEEASLELVRELLIALSYSVPDKVRNSVAAENLSSGYRDVVMNSDGDDQLRLDLISISDTPSPDISG
ncbi:uncharacterized protein LOC127813905 isoform X2 [Diospyros lotus]|uniref:uncharacterized protein LOC127813905 isoform X2 n=1 Tax=Diospyros lotus TaxID=55363 RepID=UPI0022546C52|nr:uncharacterized protein LOC127813905 isoform X2 [Diospyros lotus]